MKENPLKNKTLGCEHTEIALEIHMKETDGVLIMQLSLQLSRLVKMICYLTFCDDQFICLICISILIISEVFEDSSLTGVDFFLIYVLLYPNRVVSVIFCLCWLSQYCLEQRSLADAFSNFQ